MVTTNMLNFYSASGTDSFQPLMSWILGSCFNKVWRLLTVKVTLLGHGERKFQHKL